MRTVRTCETQNGPGVCTGRAPKGEPSWQQPLAALARLTRLLRLHRAGLGRGTRGGDGALSRDPRFAERLDDIERRGIEGALLLVQGNRRKAAERLDSGLRTRTRN